MASEELLAQIEEIKRIVTHFETLLYHRQPIILKNKHTLIQKILSEELDSEIHVLRRIILFYPDTFVEKFIHKYQGRNADNANTVLSPTQPLSGEEKSPSNQLYSRIYSILNADASPRTRLQLTFPKVDTFIEYNVTGIDESQPKTALQYDNLGISLIQTAIPELTAEDDRYFIHDNLLLDLQLLSTFPIQLHCKLYQALSEQYPAFCEKLYQRNSYFRQLKDDILIYLEGGQKPREVISALIASFLRGGERETGQVEASIEAKMDFTNFMAYFNGLDPELQKSLRALRGKEYATTLDETITHLYNENCVQEAARWLQSILDNPSNATLLNSKPNLSDEKKQAIEKFYKRTHRKGLAISTVNTDHHSQIPERWLRDILGAFTITTIEDLLYIALEFPSDLYTPFFLYSRIPYPQTLLDKLAENIKTSLFSPQQVNALIQALADSIGLFGLRSLINFAITTNNAAFFFKVFSTASEEQQTEILWSNFIEGQQFCLWSLSNLAFFEAILECYPGEKFLAFIRQETRYNAKNTLLHETIKYPKAFDAIAKRLEKKDLTLLLNTANSLGQTPFFLAAKEKQWTLMLQMLNILPIEERLAAFTHKDPFKRNIVYYLRQDVDKLNKSLKLLKPEDVFPALSTTYHLPNKRQETVFHSMAESITKLEKLLIWVTPDECFTAMTIQDSNGNTPLHIAAPHLKAITALMRKILPEKRQAALEKTNTAGESVLELCKTDSKIIRTLSTLLPEAEAARPMAITKQPSLLIQPRFFDNPSKNPAKRRKKEEGGEAAEMPSSPGLPGI